uniref:Wall-associated receptor kinase galacturonan-binding domain-containing protein n=1 Tax=Plectus sambesii TaxID=2011161 RepID=A0A914WWT5_9BILA
MEQLVGKEDAAESLNDSDDDDDDVSYRVFSGDAMHARQALPVALTLFLLLPSASSLGCMPTICEGNPKNDLRDCPDSDGTCGRYHGTRKGGRVVDGVDIKCRANAVVYAPFDGDMYFWSAIHYHYELPPLPSSRDIHCTY